MKQLRHFYSELLGGKPSPSEFYMAREDTIIREEILAVRREMAKRRAKQARRREKIIHRTQEVQLVLPFANKGG